MDKYIFMVIVFSLTFAKIITSSSSDDYVIIYVLASQKLVNTSAINHYKILK